MKVVGVFEAGGSAYESEVWVDRELLRQAYGREGIVSSVRVRLDSPAKFDAFRRRWKTTSASASRRCARQTFYEKQSEGTSALHRRARDA